MKVAVSRLFVVAIVWVSTIVATPGTETENGNVTPVPPGQVEQDDLPKTSLPSGGGEVGNINKPTIVAQKDTSLQSSPAEDSGTGKPPVSATPAEIVVPNSGEFKPTVPLLKLRLGLGGTNLPVQLPVDGIKPTGSELKPGPEEVKPKLQGFKLALGGLKSIEPAPGVLGTQQKEEVDRPTIDNTKKGTVDGPIIVKGDLKEGEGSVDDLNNEKVETPVDYTPKPLDFAGYPMDDEVLENFKSYADQVLGPLMDASNIYMKKFIIMFDLDNTLVLRVRNDNKASLDELRKEYSTLPISKNIFQDGIDEILCIRPYAIEMLVCLSKYFIIKIFTKRTEREYQPIREMIEKVAENATSKIRKPEDEEPIRIFDTGRHFGCDDCRTVVKIKTDGGKEKVVVKDFVKAMLTTKEELKDVGPKDKLADGGSEDGLKDGVTKVELQDEGRKVELKDGDTKDELEDNSDKDELEDNSDKEELDDDSDKEELDDDSDADDVIPTIPKDGRTMDEVKDSGTTDELKDVGMDKATFLKKCAVLVEDDELAFGGDDYDLNDATDKTTINDLRANGLLVEKFNDIRQQAGDEAFILMTFKFLELMVHMSDEHKKDLAKPSQPAAVPNNDVPVVTDTSESDLKENSEFDVVPPVQGKEMDTSRRVINDVDLKDKDDKEASKGVPPPPKVLKSPFINEQNHQFQFPTHDAVTSVNMSLFHQPVEYQYIYRPVAAAGFL